MPLPLEAFAQPHPGAGPAFQALRLPDLRSAGIALADALSAYAGRPDAVVLALVRGAVPAATEVANRLGLPLDLILVRKLFVPEGRDSMQCALNVGGTLVLDEGVPPLPAVPQQPIDFFLSDALAQLDQRTRACRGDRPTRDLAGRTVLLVDSGIRSGLTITVATRALRRLRPARVVAAVPVSAPECRAPIEAVVDELVCLAWPHPFGNVALWYVDFRPPDEAQVRALLDEADAVRAAGA